MFFLRDLNEIGLTYSLLVIPVLFTSENSTSFRGMNDFLYHYTARVLSVYDGDTVRVAIDLGFGIEWLRWQRSLHTTLRTEYS